MNKKSHLAKQKVNNDVNFKLKLKLPLLSFIIAVVDWNNYPNSEVAYK